MKRLILLFTLLPLFTIAQQTYVPDPQFESYLETHDWNGSSVSVGDPTSMGNGVDNDNYVTTANIDTITNLYLYLFYIWDLTGIQDFTNLENLNLSNNPLNVNPDFSSNINLKTLDISDCSYSGAGITNLDISNNTLLTHLYCGYNKISSLDLSNNTALEYLSCYNNQLTSLDLSNNTALEYLSCYNNQLTSLDVSNNPSLEHLSCSGNPLNALNINSNSILQTLHCSNNNLTSLSVMYNPAITDLICSGNQLVYLDLVNQTSLTTLDCNSSNVICLNLKNGNNFNMTSINATSNPTLTCIDVDDSLFTTAVWIPGSAYQFDNYSFSTDCGLPCSSSITDIQENTNSINLYPNPTQDQITIDIKGYNGSVNVEVYDLQGRLLETTRTTTVSLRKYERGIYIFKVSYGEITEEVRVVRE